MQLRPFTSEDFPTLKKWVAKPHVKGYFGEDVKDWLVEIEANTPFSEWIYYFIFELAGTPIGFAQYYNVEKAPEGIWADAPQGTVGIDYLIGEESLLNQGHGTKAIAMLVDEIQRQNAYYCIVADPAPNNTASVRILEKNGFLPRPGAIYKLYFSKVGNQLSE